MIILEDEKKGLIEWNETALEEAWKQAINEYKMQKSDEKEVNFVCIKEEEDKPLSENGDKLPGEQKIFQEDEILKNLLISWYNAGYYAGLLEGRRSK
jgi:hypothetical protein